MNNNIESFTRTDTLRKSFEQPREDQRKQRKENRDKPLLHSFLELWKKKVMVEKVDALDVGKNLRNDVTVEHLLVTISNDQLKLKNLNEQYRYNKRN